MSAAAALADVDDALGVAAPLPRSNGELVFEEVWQGRALGLGVVVLEHTGAPWNEFRDHLVAAIAAHEPAPGESAATAYYTAWLDAIEALLAARGLTGKRQAEANLHEVMAANAGEDGVLLGSGAWIVTARR